MGWATDRLLPPPASCRMEHDWGIDAVTPADVGRVVECNFCGYRRQIEAVWEDPRWTYPVYYQSRWGPVSGEKDESPGEIETRIVAAEARQKQGLGTLRSSRSAHEISAALAKYAHLASPEMLLNCWSVLYPHLGTPDVDIVALTPEGFRGSKAREDWREPGWNLGPVIAQNTGTSDEPRMEKQLAVACASGRFWVVNRSGVDASLISHYGRNQETYCLPHGATVVVQTHSGKYKSPTVQRASYARGPLTEEAEIRTIVRAAATQVPLPG